MRSLNISLTVIFFLLVSVLGIIPFFEMLLGPELVKEAFNRLGESYRPFKAYARLGCSLYLLVFLGKVAPFALGSVPFACSVGLLCIQYLSKIKKI